MIGDDSMLFVQITLFGLVLLFLSQFPLFLLLWNPGTYVPLK